MGKTVTLKHQRRMDAKMIVYFYDGLLVAEGGLLTIPVEKKNWIRRSWFKGFNETVDGKKLFTENDLNKYVQESVEATEREEKNARVDSGRQPDAKDGVRTSQRRSSPSVSK